MYVYFAFGLASSSSMSTQSFKFRFARSSFESHLHAPQRFIPVCGCAVVHSFQKIHLLIARHLIEDSTRAQRAGMKRHKRRRQSVKCRAHAFYEQSTLREHSKNKPPKKKARQTNSALAHIREYALADEYQESHK